MSEVKVLNPQNLNDIEYTYKGHTRTFQEVIPDSASLWNFMDKSIYKGYLGTDAQVICSLTYAMLSAMHKNDFIKQQDETRFVDMVLTRIFQYAPAWYKRLKLQQYLVGLELTDKDLLYASKVWYNHAMYNGSAVAAEGDNELLKAINEQTQTHYKRGKIEALQTLAGLLATDVSEEYIHVFDDLFSQVAMQFPVIYETKYGGEE